MALPRSSSRSNRRALSVLAALSLSALGLALFHCSGGSSGGSGDQPPSNVADSGTKSGFPTNEDGGSKGGDDDAGGADAGPLANCFSIADDKALTIEMVQDVSPPGLTGAGDFLTSSTSYPASYYATSTISAISSNLPATATKLKRAYAMPANRCMLMTGITPANGCANSGNPKGNTYASPALLNDASTDPLLVGFSTLAKADACTVIQAKRAVNAADDATLKSDATTAGLTLFEDANHQKLVNDPARKTVTIGGKPYDFLVDECIIETTSEAADANGIFLTYEVQDARTAAQTLALFQSLAAVTAGVTKELVVVTLGLTTLTTKGSGIDSTNIRTQIDAVQGFGSNVNGEPDYQAQLVILTADGGAPLSAAEKKKMLLKVNMAGADGGVIDLSEAEALRGHVVTEGYRGFIIFRNGTNAGGDCNDPDNHNQVLACLAYGACDGGFRN